jgi:hypothetical protein
MYRTETTTLIVAAISLFLFNCSRQEKQDQTIHLGAKTEQSAQEKVGTITKELDGFWGVKFGATINEAIETLKAKKPKKLKVDSTSLKDMRVHHVYVEGLRFAENWQTSYVSLGFFENKFMGGSVQFLPSYEYYDGPVLILAGVLGLFGKLKSDVDQTYYESYSYNQSLSPYREDEAGLYAIKKGYVNLYARWSFPSERTIELTLERSLSVILEYRDWELTKKEQALEDSISASEKAPLSKDY